MKQTLPRLLAFSLLATLLGLALINVAAWVWEYAKYGTTQEEGRPKGLYVIGDKGRPQLKPGAHLKGLLYEIQINSLGFRGPEIAIEKSPRTTRIWCAGGSTTFDIFASNNDTTWAGQLQQILDGRWADRDVEVINAGIPGEIISGNLEDWERLAPRLKPEILVLYEGPNDLRKITDAKFGSPNTAPMTDVALIRLLHRVMAFRPTGILLPSVPPQWDEREIDVPDLEPLLEKMQHFIDVARAEGVEVVLTSHALAAPPDAEGKRAKHALEHVTFIYQMTPRRVIDAFELMNRKFHELAESQGLIWADVRNAVPQGSEYWGDSIHFDDPGSRLAAEAIADAIVKARP